MDHALCLRAQAQCAKATDAVRPHYSPRYSTKKPPEPGYQFTSRAWSDIVSRKLYDPELGWMPTEQYMNWKYDREEVVA
jgi:hypothetical protein